MMIRGFIARLWHAFGDKVWRDTFGGKDYFIEKRRKQRKKAREKKGIWGW